jgi:hypothetical protein
MVPDILPLKAHHLLALHTRPHTGNINLGRPEVREMLLKGEAFAATDRGEVFAAAGVTPVWNGVGHGWAILAVPTGTVRLRFVTRAVRRFLDENKTFHRIQTTVCVDFVHGLSWAYHHLGFTAEGKLVKYDPEGNDHISFARVY